MTTRSRMSAGVPEVESVVCKSGRPEIANDPMTVNLTDVIVALKPRETWRFAHEGGAGQGDGGGAGEGGAGADLLLSRSRSKCACAELIAGVKTDVGISLYGDDLDALRANAEQVAAVLGKVPGAADVAGRADRRPAVPTGDPAPRCSRPAWHQRPRPCSTRLPRLAARRWGRCSRGSGGSRFRCGSRKSVREDLDETQADHGAGPAGPTYPDWTTRRLQVRGRPAPARSAATRPAAARL